MKFYSFLLSTTSNSRSITPSPSPSPGHSNVQPSHLPLQNISPRLPKPNTIHRLALNRGVLHSRQASNNSNQQSSLDDSGMGDDHDGDDGTSVEEHDKREHRAEKSQERSPREHSRVQQPSPQVRLDCPPVPVTVSVKTGGNREIQVLRCNGVKTKKHMYALPPEYLSQIVVLGE